MVQVTRRTSEHRSFTTTEKTGEVTLQNQHFSIELLYDKKELVLTCLSFYYPPILCSIVSSGGVLGESIR